MLSSAESTWKHIMVNPVYTPYGREFEELINMAEKKYKSEMERYILRKILAMTENTFERHSRIFSFFTVLRFSRDHIAEDPDSLACIQRTDMGAITRGMDSLKSQIREEHRRSGRSGAPSYPAYAWVRERNTSEYPHYHSALLFDRNVYAFRGNYSLHDGNNMANRVQKAWCSAVKLDYPDYAHLVQFTQKSYWLDRNDAIQRSPKYVDYLMRLAYLAKENTKDVHSSYRNFGTSQMITAGKEDAS